MLIQMILNCARTFFKRRLAQKTKNKKIPVITVYFYYFNQCCSKKWHCLFHIGKSIYNPWTICYLVPSFIVVSYYSFSCTSF